MAEWRELDQLLDRYIEGAASEADVRQLDDLLLADEGAARRSAERILAHRHLAELATEANLHNIMSRYADGLPGATRLLTDQITHRAAGGGEAGFDRIGSAPASASRRRASPWVWIAGAAVVAAALAVIAPPKTNAPVPDALPSPARTVPMATIAATITQLADAVWAPGEPQFRSGQPLPEESRLVLASGMAKVTFECGAEVVLEGPCDFFIRDKMVGLLNHGKLAANVPRRAFSFAILSPRVDFVDLGTSFGISVDTDGRSELHVFEGEVLYSPTARTDDRRGESVHVLAESAVKFDAAGAPQGIAMDAGEFSPLLALRRAVPDKLPPLDGVNLALWLAADAGVSTDDRQRVLSWQDILASENRTAEDATQYDEHARPQWISRAINARPAVRFDGSSDFLVTTPLETTDDQTVLLVCQFASSAFGADRHWGGQILNYDGPPSREAGNTLAPGILQIGEPLLASEFHPSLVTAQVFAGFIGSAVVETGRVDAEPIGADRPAIISYRYDYSGGRAELAINGRSYGESRAFAPQALTSRKIIGRHAWKELFFHGDLAELLIFNSALSPQQLADATDYLSRKYAIPWNDAAAARTP